MMASKPSTLHFTAIRIHFSNEIRGNFIRLPSSIVQTLESTGISIQEFGIGIFREGKELLHVGWDGYESQGYINGQPSIDINPILAKEFNLFSGLAVDLNISRYGDAQAASEVYVEPETSDDWEIIESNSMFFQDEILHQTRVVTVGEMLICYVDNVVSKFRIQKIIPANLKSAKINTGSLIIVAPRENKLRAPRDSPKHQELKKIPHNATTLKRTVIRGKEVELRNVEARVHPSDLEYEYAFISIVHNSFDIKHNQSVKNAINKYSHNIAVTVASDVTIPNGSILLSPLVWNSLYTSPQNGLKLKVEFFDGHSIISDPSKIKVLVKPLVDEEEATRKDRRKILHTPPSQEGPSQAVMDLISSLKCSIVTHKMICAQEKVIIELSLDSNGKHPLVADFKENPIDDNWQFLATEEVKLPLADLNSNLDINPFLKKAMGLEHLVATDLVEEMTGFLTLPITPSCGVMLEGGPGMGKTTLLQQVTNRLVLVHGKYVRYVDCDSLLESSNLGRMKQLLQECCSLCYWHAPSILLLDNASTLFPSVKSEDPQQAQLQRGGPTSTKLAMTLINCIQAISKKTSEAVRVVLCDHGRNSLDDSFFDKHFISETFELKALDTEARTNMIQFYLEMANSRLEDDLQSRDIALETEGYSPLDLKLLVEKMCYNLKIIQKDDTFTSLLNKNIFAETLASFTPSSLQGVKLTKGTGVKWDDIGALSAPKRLLLETLEWPTKYAPIFANCPLHLRSGILLYGYPGCGKTMLASAVAQQCGINFITVKGPEILDKYIGASEQNVRKLFERAQSVKPCILFFDEFDSIAPKRGHDSTGVTDRIVNQLLTQMDGVEGLDNVYVLVATSRPDLIDPALLRPGRIDKSVLCNIPNAHDRYDILRAITAKMKIAPGIDLHQIVKRTKGHTGADLQGLCYNAYLKAVHRGLNEQEEQQQQQRQKEEFGFKDKLESQEIVHSVINGGETTEILQCLRSLVEINANRHQESKAETNLPTPIITQQDLLTAAEETKPSISAHELNKLRSIYDRFQDNRDGDMPNGENSIETGTRTSLA